MDGHVKKDGRAFPLVSLVPKDTHDKRILGSFIVSNFLKWAMIC